MAGYSGTPLPQKLGIKPGLVLVVLDAPPNYAQLVQPLPEGAQIRNQLEGDVELNFVHLFTTRRAALQKQLTQLRRKIAPAGTLWVSWPKKAAKVPTDVTEDVIRAIALPLGFVDTKVCAVDATWSGLKLMVRRENRAPKKTK